MTTAAIKVLAGLAVIGLALAAWHARYAAGYTAGVAAGKSSEKLAYATAQNLQLAVANARILSLEEAARAAEYRHAEQLAALATEHQQELDDARKTARSALSNLERGALRLRDPGARAVSCPRASGDLPTQARTGAGSSDGATSGELSAAASRFLIELASDADETALQLATCQAVIRADRTLDQPALEPTQSSSPQ